MALSEFATPLYSSSPPQNLNVAVHMNYNNYHFRPLTETSSDVMQTMDVPGTADMIKVLVTGSGIAVLQVILNVVLIKRGCLTTMEIPFI